MEYDQIIKRLKSLSNPKNVQGMARFGINPRYTLGINIPALRKLAKDVNAPFKTRISKGVKKKHRLAQKLWSSKIHEARILASMIDAPELVTERQMDSWINDFNSWDLCDQVCMNLFDKTPLAYKKAVQWSKLEAEFEKRAGFSLMARLAWHDKSAPDKKFLEFFPHIKRASTDARNFVKKGANWALRNIGKRNKNLNEEAIKLAKEIEKNDSKAARWIAKDALRELTSEKIQKRINI